MNKDLISVIVPVYNAANYLDKCIQSIVNQTYQEIEILLIDDASQDDSVSICKKWKTIDSRIRVFTKANAGVSSARNYGLTKASGQMIAFVDSDDYILEDMLSVLYDNLMKYQADIAEVDFCLTDEKKYHKKKRGQFFKILSQDKALIELFSGNVIENIVCNKLYRKAILSDIKFIEDIHSAEDLYFNYEAIKNANKIVVDTKTAPYQYVMRETSFMNSEFSEKTLGNLIVTQKIYDEVKYSLKPYARAKYIREVMKCINKIQDSKPTKDSLLKQEALLKEVKDYSFKESLSYLSRKHQLTLLIMKFSPKFYAFLYKTFQKQ